MTVTTLLVDRLDIIPLLQKKPKLRTHRGFFYHEKLGSIFKKKLIGRCDLLRVTSTVAETRSHNGLNYVEVDSFSPKALGCVVLHRAGKPNSSSLVAPLSLRSPFHLNGPRWLLQRDGCQEGGTRPGDTYILKKKKKKENPLPLNTTRPQNFEKLISNPANSPSMGDSQLLNRPCSNCTCKIDVWNSENLLPEEHLIFWLLD